ncbi:uncharacterized protein LOC142348687 isoform X2 [Convolutriloba macropyga]|uniref:uncharacterized protein LOC142348687 isoform X2 n=1 Tax=Convolutriloba macropyga TaxID=536237 RepID=UPI003F526CE0
MVKKSFIVAVQIISCTLSILVSIPCHLNNGFEIRHSSDQYHVQVIGGLWKIQMLWDGELFEEYSVPVLPYGKAVAASRVTFIVDNVIAMQCLCVLLFTAFKGESKFQSVLIVTAAIIHGYKDMEHLWNFTFYYGFYFTWAALVFPGFFMSLVIFSHVKRIVGNDAEQCAQNYPRNMGVDRPRVQTEIALSEIVGESEQTAQYGDFAEPRNLQRQPPPSYKL